jgi:hypothetical protein
MMTIGFEYYFSKKDHPKWQKNRLFYFIQIVVNRTRCRIVTIGNVLPEPI